jgi:hypothetical protein
MFARATWLTGSKFTMSYRKTNASKTQRCNANGTTLARQDESSILRVTSVKAERLLRQQQWQVHPQVPQAAYHAPTPARQVHPS